MTPAALPRPLLAKEARALLPVWLAAVVVMVPGAVTGSSGFIGWGMLAFVFGTVALGALSIGHEYSHGTLSTLLAQPIRRSRLLLSKLAVLLPLLLSLGALASLMLLRTGGLLRADGGSLLGRQWAWALVALAPLLGLVVAPWLTMVCRSPTAGMVFTLAVPAGLWTAGQIARAAVSGFDTAALEYGPALTVMVGGVLVVSAAALVSGRAMFLRLEAPGAPREVAVGSRRSERSVPAFPAAIRHRHPIVPLARKELRLQSLAFVVAGLYAVAWTALSLGGVDAHIAGQSFQDMAGMYGCFIAMLTGALAGAEERALGTREWQTLQPYAVWKQWAITIGMAILVAFLLGTGLATIMEWGFPMIRDSGSGRIPLITYLPGISRAGVAATAAIVLTSLYVASLSTGGLRAFLATIPFSLALAWLYVTVWISGNNVTYNTVIPMLNTLFDGVDLRSSRWWQNLPTVTASDMRWFNTASNWMAISAVAGFLAMTVVLGYRNHRSAEHGSAVALRQLTWLAAFVVLGGAAAAGLPTVLLWILVSY